jgi:hypothetical protein
MKPAETLLDFARWVMDRAWADLPSAHCTLLRAIRADEWAVTDRPLGGYGDELRRSAGYVSFSAAELERQDSAAGLWIPELRLVIINLAHRSLSPWINLASNTPWRESHGMSGGMRWRSIKPLKTM